MLGMSGQPHSISLVVGKHQLNEGVLFGRAGPVSTTCKEDRVLWRFGGGPVGAWWQCGDGPVAVRRRSDGSPVAVHVLPCGGPEVVVSVKWRSHGSHLAGMQRLFGSHMAVMDACQYRPRLAVILVWSGPRPLLEKTAVATTGVPARKLKGTGMQSVNPASGTETELVSKERSSLYRVVVASPSQHI